MQFITIQDEDSLVNYCLKAERAKYLAVDTEFVRTKTLFPKLGLIQIYDGEQLALIDPLSVIDLTPFWQLLENKNILKLLHACSEDIEVFLTQGQCKPANMLDTQIAMSFLGHGLSLGYAAMVKHFFDLELDKSESRTDWLKRPLSARQLEYAAADVFHLWRLGDNVLHELKQSNLLEAAFEESAGIVSKKSRPVNPECLYKDIRGAWRLAPAQLNRLKHLCQWRYEMAVKRDLPISFIAKDATLIVLAERNPNSVGAMATYAGIDILDVRHQGKALLSVLRQSHSDDESTYPARLIRLDEYPGYKQVFKDVKSLVLKCAKEIGVAAEFLASKKQINHFLSYHWCLNVNSDAALTPELLTGWRLNVIGQELLESIESARK